MSEIKKGDRIRIIDLKGAFEIGAIVSNGDKGTVNHVFLDGDMDVEMDNGDDWTLEACHVEKITEEKKNVLTKSHLPAGTKVRIKSNAKAGHSIGDECVIVEPHDAGPGAVWVNKPGTNTPGHGMFYAVSELELVPDMVNHPPHYKLPNGIEVIDITENLGFRLGNSVKYILRADAKGAPLEDLKKAQWYLTREIETREKA